MTQPLALRRPPLLMSIEGQIQLVALADAAARRHPQVASLLHEEADRTELVAAAELPATTVALGSLVEFHDAGTGERRAVRLVLPGEADIAEGRVSVLSLVGAGLIGLSEGQSIDWPTQDGRMRRLTVLSVRPGSADL
ncbi:nucleoside diphosphate kinase regulator [Roseococcus sp. SYP-B2431]|uniref:nucleoside diphosphate kinase regulator n=1 Tax=Roseococcus sp. SYP-B2431 TaxID=2496640 RepID=UPI00103D6284|nr:nucleoside diphosphate kinase regulator [Roseococcus sp. SYP-B2431]TCH96606.1 nucleoside diphosphate kinase regulator [Roseococcus sp. SYP-B2431]